MTDLRKAAEMALYALITWKEQAPQYWDGIDAKAVDALRQALAQTEPTHTEHPIRHWDRTCPACAAE